MELMIVIAVIGIMTGVAFVSLGGSKAVKQVEVSARQLAAAIRQAQNYALSGRQDLANATRKVCGYGVYFKNTANNQYKIFYNYTINDSCDTANLTNINYDTNYNYSADVETQALQQNVAVSISSDASSAIYFTAPFGDVYYNGGALGTKQIILRSTTNDETKYTVCAYGKGNVSEKAGEAICP